MLELVLVRFANATSAAEALAAARNRSDARWFQQAGLVEHHHDGRWVLRGTFAGHYLDIDESLHYSEAGTAEGAVAGAALGTLLGGPLGLAIGGVSGAMIGSQTGRPSERDIPPESLITILGEYLAGPGSAITLIAQTADVDEMLAALSGDYTDVVRHILTQAEDSDLERSLRRTAIASPGPSAEGEYASEEPT